MLRRALDEADAAEQTARTGLEHAPPSASSESSALNLSSEENTSSDNNNSAETKRYGSVSYGTLSAQGRPAHSSDADDEEDEDGEDTYAEEDTTEDDGEDGATAGAAYCRHQITQLCGQLWNCLRFMADVEDLWDSPGALLANASRPHFRRRKWIVAFWFVVLATAYAGERSTFKFLVDKSGPFRLFSVEMVTATHGILLGLGMGVTFLFHRCQSPTSRSSISATDTFDLPLGLPVVDVGLMALLDVVSLMLVFLTGIYVSPTLTVILVQFLLPLTAFLMQFVHPDGRFACCRTTSGGESADDTDATSPSSSNTATAAADSSAVRPTVESSPPSNVPGGDLSPYATRASRPTRSQNPHQHHGGPIRGCAGLAAEHLWGSALIFLACLFALLPSFYTIIDPDFFLYADPIPLRVAYNSLFFLLACVPAAISQMYKEHIFLQYKQPVNVHKVNLLLSVFEFIFASVLSPLVFMLQGIGSETGVWYNLYPSSDFSDNFLDGLLCFFRQLDEEDQLHKYPEAASCDWVLGLAILHAVSIILVGVAVDKIVSAGATKVTHRGISAGIILAVVCMAIYDFRIPEFNYGPVVDALNLLCLVLLILGSEIYHRVSIPESTFETVYPSLDNIYQDE